MKKNAFLYALAAALPALYPRPAERERLRPSWRPVFPFCRNCRGPATKRLRRSDSPRSPNHKQEKKGTADRVGLLADFVPASHIVEDGCSRVEHLNMRA